MTAQLRQKVMRTIKIIIKLKVLWSFIKFSQLILWGNVWRSVWRISMWIFGAGVQLGRDECRGVLIQACVASVSVWFRSKERPKNGIFCFGRARNGTRAKIFPTLPTPSKFPFNPLPALSLTPFFTRSLTLVSLSWLRTCYAGYGNISA